MKKVIQAAFTLGYVFFSTTSAYFTCNSTESVMESVNAILLKDAVIFFQVNFLVSSDINHVFFFLFVFTSQENWGGGATNQHRGQRANLFSKRTYGNVGHSLTRIIFSEHFIQGRIIMDTECIPETLCMRWEYMQ